jgi:hypothetical protein
MSTSDKRFSSGKNALPATDQSGKQMRSATSAITSSPNVSGKDFGDDSETVLRLRLMKQELT